MKYADGCGAIVYGRCYNSETDTFLQPYIAPILKEDGKLFMFDIMVLFVAFKEGRHKIRVELEDRYHAFEKPDRYILGGGMMTISEERVIISGDGVILKEPEEVHLLTLVAKIDGLEAGRCEIQPISIDISTDRKEKENWHTDDVQQMMNIYLPKSSTEEQSMYSILAEQKSEVSNPEETEL